MDCDDLPDLFFGKKSQHGFTTAGAVHMKRFACDGVGEHPPVLVGHLQIENFPVNVGGEINSLPGFHLQVFQERKRETHYRHGHLGTVAELHCGITQTVIHGWIGADDIAIGFQGTEKI